MNSGDEFDREEASALAAYASLPALGPPPAIDARIRSAAHAVHAPRRSRPWLAPVATAAVAVLALGVSWRAFDLDPQRPFAQPEPVATPTLRPAFDDGVTGAEAEPAMSDAFARPAAPESQGSPPRLGRTDELEKREERAMSSPGAEAPRTVAAPTREQGRRNPRQLSAAPALESTEWDSGAAGAKEIGAGAEQKLEAGARSREPASPPPAPREAAASKAVDSTRVEQSNRVPPAIAPATQPVPPEFAADAPIAVDAAAAAPPGKTLREDSSRIDELRFEPEIEPVPRNATTRAPTRPRTATRAQDSVSVESIESGSTSLESAIAAVRAARAEGDLARARSLMDALARTHGTARIPADLQTLLR